MDLKRFQRILVPLIFCICLSCSSQHIQASEYKQAQINELFQTYRSGIVHIGLISTDEKEKAIKIEKWLGTGFVVDSKCVFITAKHVLRNVDKQRVAVRFQLPSDLTKVRTIKADVVYEDSIRDIAFLKIYQFDNRPCNSKGLHIFPLLEKENFQSLVGDEILIIGYPVIAKGSFDIPIIRNGIISSNELKWLSKKMLLLDLLGVPGFSGSPVILRKSGHVVGVVYGPGPTIRAFGFEWATPFFKDDYDEIIQKTISKQ